MSYISKEDVASIRAALKKEFPNVKFSVVRDNGSELRVAIMSSDVDFSAILDGRDNMSLNPYVPYKEPGAGYYFENEEKYVPFAVMFNKIVKIMKGAGWYDNSDCRVDYFDTKYYLSLSIGKWDKPYVLKA